MPTPTQTKLIHVAAKQVGLNDTRYRMLLRNLGDVDSSKKLTPQAFEDCMAVLEDMGFRGSGAANYWREKVRLRGMFGNERMARKIHAMATECRYSLPALCLRFSLQRTDQVERLDPREQYALIEMLKDVQAREEERERRLSEIAIEPPEQIATPTPAPTTAPAPNHGGFDDEIPF